LYGDLGGARVADSNFRLRFCLIIFSGIVALGSILYWRSKLLVSQEYVDFPQHKTKPTSLLKVKAPATTEQNQRLEKDLNNEQN